MTPDTARKARIMRRAAFDRQQRRKWAVVALAIIVGAIIVGGAWLVLMVHLVRAAWG